MNLQLDESGQNIIMYAVEEAYKLRHSSVSTAHLFLGFTKDYNSLLALALTQEGFDVRGVRTVIRQVLIPSGSGTWLNADELSERLSDNVRRVLTHSKSIADDEKVDFVSERHLLVSFLTLRRGAIFSVLEKIGIEPITLLAIVKGGADPATIAKSINKSRTPLLSKFGRNLTEAARQGKIEPASGRKHEIEQIIHILSKETKNNPLLVGEAGVGKTAIIEGLAYLIAHKQVPSSLKDKQLFEISLSFLISGTRYRGDFEERLTQMVDEIRANPDILIFIDEIHTMVGAGDGSGNLDAANILKPTLARGELRCIGATTPSEYQRTIGQDAALERRFQKVNVGEMSPEETLEILRSIKSRYETRYGVSITPEAILSTVRLSIQYLPEQRLPDKARDLLEEACVRLSIGTMGEWDEETEVNLPSLPRTVDANDIAQIIAERKQIPIEHLAKDEHEKLLDLETRLRTRIVGQDYAVTSLVKAIRLARTGLKDPSRPSGVFLFIGPTGVGKTELAKVLASELFGSQDKLIRFDMSEFMEPHSVAKLIGSPPGYIGYREEGQLVRELRSKPYSIVLLDEIEKASPNIFDLFLQLFDEGRLTDTQGHQVDGRHAIYILTSNAGTEFLGRRALGFGMERANQEEIFQRDLRAHLLQIFRQEFLNRIDEVIIFNSLLPEHIRSIALQQIGFLQQRILTEHRIRLEVMPEVCDEVCKAGYSEKLGARPLNRAITQLVAAPLSEMLVNGVNGAIVAKVVDEHIVFENTGSESI